MERNTHQRRAIEKALADANRPLGPLEILEAAKAHTSSLGIATVYRALKGLTEEGKLTTVALPGGSVRYELAGKEHHHHFHCRACEGVFEVETCGFDLSHWNPGGFHVEHHEVILYGLCASCAPLAAKGGAAPPQP